MVTLWHCKLTKGQADQVFTPHKTIRLPQSMDQDIGSRPLCSPSPIPFRFFRHASQTLSVKFACGSWNGSQPGSSGQMCSRGWLTPFRTVWSSDRTSYCFSNTCMSSYWHILLLLSNSLMLRGRQGSCKPSRKGQAGHNRSGGWLWTHLHRVSVHGYLTRTLFTV